MLHKIISRFDGHTIYECEEESLLSAVVAAVKGGADLGGADLGGADLRGADLGGADLRGADLGGADLGGADLGGADLGCAYLDGADLRGAYLDGAKINWQSHDMIAEVIFRSAGDDVEKRKIAGLVLVSRDWCWQRFSKLSSDPLWQWAIDTLKAHVINGENAPDILRNAKNTASRPEARADGSVRHIRHGGEQ